MTAQSCAEHARAGSLAAATLAQPLAFHETLNLLLEDRATLLAELRASQNSRALTSRRH